MLDLILLGTGPFLGWAIYYAVLSPIYGIEEQRWNHLLVGLEPRRVRIPLESLPPKIEAHPFERWLSPDHEAAIAALQDLNPCLCELVSF